MPLTCFQLLDEPKYDLKDGSERKVCSVQDAYTRAARFHLGEKQVMNLLPLLAKLGAILWFPHVKGAEHLLVLHPQWVVTALACIVREHNNNHNQLKYGLGCEVTPVRSTTTGLKPVRSVVVPPLLPEVDPATFMEKLKQTMQLLPDGREQAFSCDFSGTYCLPKHLFEWGLVCLAAKRFCKPRRRRNLRI